MEECIKLLNQITEAVREVFNNLKVFCKKLFENIDYEKLIKKHKYLKRVRNREKLYAKRKAKYGEKGVMFGWIFQKFYLE